MSTSHCPEPQSGCSHLAHLNSTVMNHLLDQSAHEMHSGPVASMYDDISLAPVVSKLLGIVILKVSLLNGGSVWELVYILEANASSLVSSTFSPYSSCINI